jgi:hypothetical protein
MACTISSPTVVNCLIYGNTSYYGAGIGLVESHPIIINSTICANAADDSGGGIYCMANSNPVVSNCVVWGNTPDQILADDGVPDVTYNDIQFGYAGTGNIDADPLFADPGNSDFHLMAGSPCIDAADNTTVPAWVTVDLDGKARFVDDLVTTDTGNGTPPIVDMGAYEFPFCFADLDDDREIGLGDLAILLRNYATISGASYYDGDLDQDGDVDLSDLALLLTVYGSSCL